MPGLALLVFENPEAAEPGHSEREEARDAAHERVDEAQRRSIEADDAKLTHDAAESRSFPRPEADVIREQRENEGPRAVIQEIENAAQDEDERAVEPERRCAFEEAGLGKSEQVR